MFVSRVVVIALVLIAALTGSATRAHAQDDDYEARYVRNYNRLSIATVSASALAGAWSAARPGDLSVFTGFVMAGVEYGMFLTAVRNDAIPRSRSLGHLAVGIGAGALAYYGLEQLLREKRERREESRLEIVPVASTRQSGLLLTVRF